MGDSTTTIRIINNKYNDVRLMERAAKPRRERERERNGATDKRETKREREREKRCN